MGRLLGYALFNSPLMCSGLIFWIQFFCFMNLKWTGFSRGLIIFFSGVFVQHLNKYFFKNILVYIIEVYIIINAICWLSSVVFNLQISCCGDVHTDIFRRTILQKISTWRLQIFETRNLGSEDYGYYPTKGT